MTLQFDKVEIYGFSGGIGSDMSIVDYKGRIAKSMFMHATLDNNDVLVLSKKLGEKKSYGDEMAACFEPGLGFVYYLKDKIVAHVTICLECNIVTSSIPLDPKKPEHFWANKDYLAGSPTKSFHALLEALKKKYKI